MAARGELPDAAITASGLKITPLTNSVPEEASVLTPPGYALLPHIKITDLLLEVDRRTGLSRHFIRIKIGEPAKDRILLLMAILADVINLGISKMAVACPDTTARKLDWLASLHIRDEAYTKALAELVNHGTVTASLIIRKLASYPRQNSLHTALRKVGHIERTIFMLEWMKDPDLRRRVQVWLNKVEARTALARAVFSNRQGEMRDRSFENQRYRASVPDLILAAIIHWNTLYLERAFFRPPRAWHLHRRLGPRPPLTHRMGAHQPDRRLHLAGCRTPP